MNVTIAIPCLKRGGTEMQTLNLVKVLVGTGYQVTTLCYFEHDPSVVSEYRDAGCSVALMNLERTIGPVKLICRLVKAFRVTRPHVVHVQYMAPGTLPIVAARLAGVKKVLATVHQPYTRSHGVMAKPLLRFSAFLCSRFICVSKNAEQSWFGSAQFYDENKPLKQKSNHFTIYNAVDIDKIQQIKSSTNLETLLPALPANKFIIGAVSRLRVEKGIDILIEAFTQAIQTQPNIHLLIVGSGPDAEQLQQLAANKGIVHHCTFYGEASWAVAMQQMARMDVVVVPSRFEGFGLTAAEAMAMGKPVIASRVFGLSEIILNNQNGLLFSSGNANELLQSMLHLNNNRKHLTEMGLSGFDRVKNHFSIDVFLTKTIKLYSQL